MQEAKPCCRMVLCIRAALPQLGYLNSSCFGSCYSMGLSTDMLAGELVQLKPDALSWWCWVPSLFRSLAPRQVHRSLTVWFESPIVWMNGVGHARLVAYQGLPLGVLPWLWEIVDSRLTVL